MSTHTPTPWFIAGTGTIRYGEGRDAGWIATVHWRNREANAEFLCRAVNAHDDLVAALENIFSRVSYINIHGVGEQPPPNENGTPQPVRATPDEFWSLFQDIGTLAADALKKAEAQ